LPHRGASSARSVARDQEICQSKVKPAERVDHEWTQTNPVQVATYVCPPSTAGCAGWPRSRNRPDPRRAARLVLDGVSRGGSPLHGKLRRTRFAELWAVHIIKGDARGCSDKRKRRRRRTWRRRVTRDARLVSGGGCEIDAKGTGLSDATIQCDSHDSRSARHVSRGCRFGSIADFSRLRACDR
jgi:hypothetical protein